MAAPASPLALLTPAAHPSAPPPALLPYQQRWIDDRARLKIGRKSRRIGLTWGEGADDVLDAAAAPEANGCNVFYISATEDMAREYIEACAMWARVFNVAAGEIEEGLFSDEGKNGIDRHIKTYEITFPASSHRVVALSSRPANLRGKQGKVVLDEAAFAPDLAGLIKAAMAMLMWGGRVVIISTYNGVENAFAQLIEEALAGKRGRLGKDLDVSVHTITFADAVADGLYRRVCLRKGIAWTQAGEDAWVAQVRAVYGDDAKEELDVIPAGGGGRYLGLALIAQRMVPAWSPTNPTGPALIRGRWDDSFAWLPEDVRRYAIEGWLRENVEPHLARLSPLQRHVWGMDFARSCDLSVIPIAAEDHDLTHRVRLVIELANCPHSSQIQIMVWITRRLPRWRGGASDATGNGEAVAEALAQEFGTEMVERVKMSAAWYAVNMPKMRGALQDGTLTDIPRDDNLRDDLRSIELVGGIPRVPHVNTASAAARAAAADEGGGKGGRRHGDFAVGLCLCEYAFGREAGEIDWTPAATSASRWHESGGGAGSHRMRLRAPDFADDIVTHSSGGGW